MRFRGLDREYQLVVPAGYDGRTAIPLVFGLHALTVDYRTVAASSGFADFTADHDFVAVMPSGRRNGSTPYWDASPDPRSDDVAFLAALLDQLEATLCIDTSRVFSVGMSNGAQMSSALACRLPDRIAAVAPIAGVEFFAGCVDGPPVAVIAFHGALDPVVTFDGGGLNATQIANGNLWQGNVPDGLPTHRGVRAAMRTWARRNGCAGSRVVMVSAEVEHTTWDGCDAPTELYVVVDGGHTWPGKPVPGFSQFGATTTDIDASTLIFDFFFAAHR